MHSVILLMLFMVNGRPIGAQLIGSADTPTDCQLAAGKIIHDKAGQEPKDKDGNISTPFPLCIDTRMLPASGPKQQT